MSHAHTESLERLMKAQMEAIPVGEERVLLPCSRNGAETAQATDGRSPLVVIDRCTGRSIGVGRGTNARTGGCCSPRCPPACRSRTRCRDLTRDLPRVQVPLDGLRRNLPASLI